MKGGLIISFLLIFIPIFLVLLSKFKTGTYKNPVTIVVMWWSVWAFISTFGFLGLYVPNSKTYLLVLTFIVMFSFGSILVMNRYNTIGKEIKQKLSYSLERKIDILYKMQIIVLFALIPYFIKAIPNIRTMAPSTYRLAIYNDSVLFQSSNERLLLFDIIINPIISFGILLGIVGLLLGHRVAKLLIFSILNGVIYSVMTLGRWYFLRIVIFLIVGYFFISRYRKVIPGNILKKNKKKLGLISIIAITALLLMSNYRATNESSIFVTAIEYAVRYFTGSFIALDYFLTNYGNLSDFYYGRVTLTALDTLFIYFLRRFDESIVNVTESISHFTEGFIHIGNGYTYNAFYTAIYNFYLDGGIIAVIIISFLLGIFTGTTFNLFSKQPNLFNSLLLIFVTYISIIASLRWEFINLWPLIVLIYIFIFNTKIHKNKALSNSYQNAEDEY